MSIASQIGPGVLDWLQTLYRFRLFIVVGLLAFFLVLMGFRLWGLPRLKVWYWRRRIAVTPVRNWLARTRGEIRASRQNPYAIEGGLTARWWQYGTRALRRLVAAIVRWCRRAVRAIARGSMALLRALWARITATGTALQPTEQHDTPNE
jgi:alpha-beta hydrolase superfamily lysophospholipase